MVYAKQKGVTGMDEMAQYLKEHPYMELHFRYSEEMDAVIIEWRNRTFPSLDVGRAVNFDHVQKAKRPWLLFNPPKEFL